MRVPPSTEVKGREWRRACSRRHCRVHSCQRCPAAVCCLCTPCCPRSRGPRLAGNAVSLVPIRLLPSIQVGAGTLAGSEPSVLDWLRLAEKHKQLGCLSYSTIPSFYTRLKRFKYIEHCINVWNSVPLKFYVRIINPQCFIIPAFTGSGLLENNWCKCQRLK